MKENKENSNSGSPWWKPAAEMFSEVSMWIVLPIVLALVLGKALDSHYGTKPTIFLSLAGFGFFITCFGMFRVVKNYIKNIEKIKDKDKDKDY